MQRRVAAMGLILFQLGMVSPPVLRAAAAGIELPGSVQTRELAGKPPCGAETVPATGFPEPLLAEAGVPYVPPAGRQGAVIEPSWRISLRRLRIEEYLYPDHGLATRFTEMATALPPLFGED